MRTRDFDYELPKEQIAQEPTASRDASRMLVVERAAGRLVHTWFRNLPEYVGPGDLFVVNDTSVIPARIFGRKAATGGRVELLMLEEVAQDEWEALVRASLYENRPVKYSLETGVTVKVAV